MYSVIVTLSMVPAVGRPLGSTSTYGSVEVARSRSMRAKSTSWTDPLTVSRRPEMVASASTLSALGKTRTVASELISPSSGRAASTVTVRSSEPWGLPSRVGVQSAVVRPSDPVGPVGRGVSS